ncbi:5-oxoprolinase subunit C family protein [Devosia rhizoryzae]|uniref:Biotin-dependent carboxyltransferase family protein n=1 Tax=Devosia rhizoryzae TaxID=2774137 RepID=A0ABX7C8X7_9HYPH|nr:biotin-dependent carboxyltransferase family protein [Devosia rhizoryzae]QQR40673.1 biotin-dependent carboxyltransferase family protein [Devosia rhizoryzae]
MPTLLRIERAGPLTTIQDRGRFGMLRHGVSASGPMDRAAFERAGLRSGAIDDAGIEFTHSGLALVVEGEPARIGWAGGKFRVELNGTELLWPGSAVLKEGDNLSITPGSSGVYGYLRFSSRLQLPGVLGSVATSSRARLGGLEGRPLRAGDELTLIGKGVQPIDIIEPDGSDAPIRFIWGVHAERFSKNVRERFTDATFRVSPSMDRMGVRLVDEGGVFAGASILSLVSEPVMPGDIQILGDGTPIVLMRDHQPTGGYPRIGTVITADLDRFAQLRGGSTVAFAPVTVDHAHRLLRSTS